MRAKKLAIHLALPLLEVEARGYELVVVALVSARLACADRLPRLQHIPARFVFEHNGGMAKFRGALLPGTSRKRLRCRCAEQKHNSQDYLTPLAMHGCFLGPLRKDWTEPIARALIEPAFRERLAPAQRW